MRKVLTGHNPDMGIPMSALIQRIKTNNPTSQQKKSVTTFTSHAGQTHIN
jgi:hypothetical protein